MRFTRPSLIAAFFLVACGGSGSGPDSQTPSTAGGNSSSDSSSSGSSSSGSSSSGSSSNDNEFQIKDSATAGTAHGATESKIEATATHAAMKFFVIDKGKDEPIQGIVISLKSADGKKYYTGETDEVGYGEVLVPVGKAYDLTYLSLGRKDIAAKVTVTDEPRQNIKLTLRYKPRAEQKVTPVASAGPETDSEPVQDVQPVFRLDGVNFGSNSFEMLPESFERLDSVVEYLTYKESARIEISGHTDNVGRPAKNKALSQKRADACRAYFIEKGIDGSRIEAVGRGDEQPVASNDTDEGRQQNRRIEAREL